MADKLALLAVPQDHTVISGAAEKEQRMAFSDSCPLRKNAEITG
jgi:hypothetical protein